jgi:hypothetical protein
MRKSPVDNFTVITQTKTAATGLSADRGGLRLSTPHPALRATFSRKGRRTKAYW